MQTVIGFTLIVCVKWHHHNASTGFYTDYLCKTTDGKRVRLNLIDGVEIIYIIESSSKCVSKCKHDWFYLDLRCKLRPQYINLV